MVSNGSMQLRRVFSVLSVVLFALFVGAHTVSAATYYVSPSGNDSNTGTSEGTAWRTLQHAGDVARAGDTVNILPGSYSNSGAPVLRPANSGTATAPIVFRGQGTRPILIGTNAAPEIIDLSNRDYITIENLELRDPCSNWCRWLTLNNSDRNIINDVRFIITGTSRGVDWTGVNFTNSTYNRLSNCHVDGWGIFGDPYNNGGDAIQLNGASHHNIVEGCFIGAAGHAGLQLDGGDTYNNVIRNNTFQNRLEKAFETTQRRGGRFEYNLFEGNTCIDSRYNSEWHGGMCLHINANRNIIRRNVLRGALGWGADFQVWGSETLSNVGNHVFHNTVVNNGIDQTGYHTQSTTGFEITDFGYTGAPFGDHRFKNNIFYDNKPQTNFSPPRSIQLLIGLDSSRSNAPLAGIHVAGNLMYGTNTTEPVITVYGIGDYNADWFNRNYPNNFWGNIQQAPQFVTYDQGTANNPLDGTFDLRLRTGSPGIDQGVDLTTTTGAGSGRTVAVADAGYFHDGWGIIAPDQIMVGSQPATITAIDYANNRITVDRDLSWAANTGVNLQYSGNRPDIGAFESGSSGPPTPTPTGTATPTPTPIPTPTPAACRADLNNDTYVNAQDRSVLIANIFLAQPTNSRADINGNGQVDVTDYSLLATVFGQRCQ